MITKMNNKVLTIWIGLSVLFMSTLNGQDVHLLEQADALSELEEYEAANLIYDNLSNTYLINRQYDDYLSTRILQSENYDYFGAPDSARIILKQAIATVAREEVKDSLLALTYHKLANIEYGAAQDEEAIRYWQQALKIRTQIFSPNHLDIIKLYRNLGNSYFNLELWEKSREHFQKAADLHLTREEKDAVLLAKTYNDLGKVYTILEDFDQAAKYLQVAMADYKKLFSEEPWNLYYVYENVFDLDRIRKNYPSMVRSQKEIF